MAALVLALSFFSIANELIDDYNKEVWVEQFDRYTIAKSGVTFSHDWDWGVNYPKRNRHLIFLFVLAGFVFSVLPRIAWASLLAYGLTFPLVYQWVTITMRDLTYNDAYMAGSPYLLRITSATDWTLFGGLVVAFVVNLAFLVLGRETKS